MKIPARGTSERHMWNMTWFNPGWAITMIIASLIWGGYLSWGIFNAAVIIASHAWDTRRYVRAVRRERRLGQYGR